MMKTAKTILFLSALIFFLASANFYFYQNFSKSAEIKRYETLSSQFSPNSIQAKRYRAVADALEQDSTAYQFLTGRIPTLTN